MAIDNESEIPSILMYEAEQDSDSVQEDKQASSGLIQRLKDFYSFFITHLMIGGVVIFANSLMVIGLMFLSPGLSIDFLLPIYDPSSPASVFLLMGVFVLSGSVLLGMFFHLSLDMVWPERPIWNWKAIMLTGFLVLLPSFPITSLWLFIDYGYISLVLIIPDSFHNEVFILLAYLIVFSFPVLIGSVTHKICNRVYSRLGCLKSAEPVQEPHFSQ